MMKIQSVINYGHFGSSWNECHTSLRDETQELVTERVTILPFHGEVVYICVLPEPCAICELLDNISYQHQSYASSVLRYWYLNCSLVSCKSLKIHNFWGRKQPNNKKNGKRISDR